jgi:L-Ala-D/L-Glu epimerase
MRIAALETVRFALPFREPYVTARGALGRRELLLVRLHAHGGGLGLGEAAPLSLRGGPDLAAIDRELHDVCAPILDGVKVTMATLAGIVSTVRAAGISAQAQAAVDMALHDLAGRIEGEPVWRMLGAHEARPVHCNATLVAGEPAAVAAQAARWGERGFTTFKLKVGVAQDREAVAAVREAVGSTARIRVDANGVWGAEEAVEQLDALARHDLELAEQPAVDLAGLAHVRRAVRVPIAADESVATPEDAERAVEQASCDVATAKLAKCGGIAATLDVAREIPVYLSSALDGPLGIAAAAHLSQILPRPGLAASLAQGLATQELFATTIAARGPELSGPELVLTDEPGLGVEIDELALARLRI